MTHCVIYIVTKVDIMCIIVNNVSGLYCQTLYLCVKNTETSVEFITVLYLFIADGRYCQRKTIFICESKYESLFINRTR